MIEMSRRNLIIFEGTDNTGKSTQVIKLFRYMNSKDHFTQMLHNSFFPLPEDLSPKEKMNAYERYYIKQANILKDDDRSNWIFDRSHIGEFVYGQLYRGYTNTEIFFNVEKILEKNFNVFLILMMDSAENLVKREDGNSIGLKLEDKQKELELFTKTFDLTIIDNKILINVDFTIDTKEGIHNQIVSFIQNCFF